MSEILKLYKKSIYANLGNKDVGQISMLDRARPPYDTIIPDKSGLIDAIMPDYDVDFSNQSLLERYEEYEPIAEKYKIPIVIGGFEPVDLLQGILMLIRQLENNESNVEKIGRASCRERV